VAVVHRKAASVGLAVSANVSHLDQALPDPVPRRHLRRAAALANAAFVAAGPCPLPSGRAHDDPGGRGGAERARQLRRRRGVNVGFAGLLVSVNRGREPVHD